MSPWGRESFEQHDWEYVAVYVASECLAGKELTTGRFRSFLDRTFGPTILSSAERVIQEMKAVAVLSPPREACMRPYMYPETPAEGQLAMDLAMVPSYERISPRIWGSFLSGAENSRYRWFDTDDSKNVTYFQWWCERGWC